MSFDLESCCNCTSCDLATTRQSVVISRGNPSAPLMLIGEAPGAQEDTEGRPFVGRSGRALDALLHEVGLDPDRDLYICNAIKCRPPTTDGRKRGNCGRVARGWISSWPWSTRP